jgi:hypothetical protein
MSTATCKHSMMTKLIDDLELRALKSSPNSVNVVINSEDLLILVEYARQLRRALSYQSMRPVKKAKQFYKGIRHVSGYFLLRSSRCLYGVLLLSVMSCWLEP